MNIRQVINPQHVLREVTVAGLPICYCFEGTAVAFTNTKLQKSSECVLLSCCLFMPMAEPTATLRIHP